MAPPLAPATAAPPYSNLPYSYFCPLPSTVRCDFGFATCQTLGWIMRCGRRHCCFFLLITLLLLSTPVGIATVGVALPVDIVTVLIHATTHATIVQRAVPRRVWNPGIVWDPGIAASRKAKQAIHAMHAIHATDAPRNNHTSYNHYINSQLDSPFVDLVVVRGTIRVAVILSPCRAQTTQAIPIKSVSVQAFLPLRLNAQRYCHLHSNNNGIRHHLVCVADPWDSTRQHSISTSALPTTNIASVTSFEQRFASIYSFESVKSLNFVGPPMVPTEPIFESNWGRVVEAFPVASMTCPPAGAPAFLRAARLALSAILPDVV